VSRAGIYFHSGAQRKDVFLLVLLRKLLRASDTLTPGLQGAPDWESFHFQYYSAKTTFAALGSQYGDTTVVAESLIAQFHSHGKLTPRHENRKIRHEIEILKAEEPTPYV
jgi:hypothetical protein